MEYLSNMPGKQTLQEGLKQIEGDGRISKRIVELKFSQTEFERWLRCIWSPSAMSEMLIDTINESNKYDNAERKSLAVILKRLLGLGPRLESLRAWMMLNGHLFDGDDATMGHYERSLARLNESKADFRRILCDLRHKAPTSPSLLSRKKIHLWHLYTFLNSKTRPQKWKDHANLIARILAHLGYEYTPSNIKRDLSAMRSWLSRRKMTDISSLHLLPSSRRKK